MMAKLIKRRSIQRREEPEEEPEDEDVEEPETEEAEEELEDEDTPEQEDEESVEDDDGDIPPAFRRGAKTERASTSKPNATNTPKPVVTKKVVVPPPPVKKVAKKVVEEPEEEEEVEVPEKKLPKVKTVSDVVVDNLFDKLMEALPEGKALIITRVGDSKYQVSMGDAVKAAGNKEKAHGTLTGKAYWEEVCTPEYLEWQVDWQKMSPAEKAAYAKKHGVDWVHDKNELVNNMRMTQAVMDQQGIKKYKDQYQSQKARAAVKG